MKRLDRSEIIFKILAYVLLTLFALACLYPFVYLLSASISAKSAVDGGDIVLWPIGLQFDAYAEIFADSKFWLSYCNTLFYTMPRHTTLQKDLCQPTCLPITENIQTSKKIAPA